MSSNIRVQRVCQYCQEAFIARTTVTKYCGERCAKRAYKQRKKAEKIQRSNKQTLKTTLEPIEQLKAKEILTVPEVARLLQCSKRTIYRLVNNQTIQATNLAVRMIRVKRSEVDKLLNNPTPIEEAK